MITCPACGKENEDSALDCKRCRAPLHEEGAHAHAEAAAEPAQEPHAGAPASSELGTVCRRCEAYNEPGVRECTACGYDLFAEAMEDVTAEQAAREQPAEPSLDKTPPQAFAPEIVEGEPPADSTPPDGQPSLSDELAALSLSDQEAAEAGLSTGNGAQAEPPLDKTPPQPYPVAEPPAHLAAAAELGASISRRAPEPPAPAKAPPPASAAAAEKTCASCGASNPPAARFCFDCGTPFAKKPEPAPKVEAPPAPALVKPVAVKREPPPSIQIDSSIQVDAELGAEHISDSTAESAPVPADEPVEELPAEEAVAAEELPAEEAAVEAAPLEEAIEEAPPAEEEPVPAESVAEAIEEETPPPFAASLVVEKGNAQGTAFLLAHLENSVGGSGTRVELAEDPFIAPHAATLTFAEDRLVVRDEGSANGVFVKLREPAPLETGDHFQAGERLFRYDGPTELTKNGESDTPFLGAPRPQAAAVRVTEVLAGGKTGRTCHRSGPAISVGRTGCDMNFPGDSLMAAKHAEIRLGEDGTATLVDLGQTPAGVWLRLRPQGLLELQAGDLLQIGEQQLRVQVG